MNYLACYGIFPVFFTAQILFNCGQAFPLRPNEETVTRWKRSSSQSACARKRWLLKPSGVITSPSRNETVLDHVASCKWIIHVSRGHRVKLEFRKFHVFDTCPGICKCNYVMVRAMNVGKRIVSEKYCNERMPPKNVLYHGNRVKLHFRLKTGDTLSDNHFNITYATVPGERTPAGITPPKKVPRKKTLDKKIDSLDYSRIAAQKLGTSDKYGITTTPSVTTQRHEVEKVKDGKEEEEKGPSKLTVLLGVAIPVVMIFIIVVLIIAYYNHLEEKRQQQASESPQTGSNIGELILNSSIALAPMVNLRKAKRESSRRKEKANKLYDDMLQSWKQTNESRNERLKAKQESVNVWESYQKSRKSRRSVSKDAHNDGKAFAVLVSNAINSVEEEPEQEERNDSTEVEIFLENPRPSSILIIRGLLDDSPRKRSSKVLSWCDLSTKFKGENLSEKRSTSADNIEMRKSTPAYIAIKDDSSHIPAIVVSQPSFESEDSEACAETDRLIKDKADGSKPDVAGMEASGVKPSYSCAEHVKDILRDSYGDENDEWWQKPKKTQSQGSLKESSPSSNVKYATMADKEEDDID